MSVAALDREDFREWHRLNQIATKHEPKMRLAYTRAIRNFEDVDSEELARVIQSIVVETAYSTAQNYSLLFSLDSEVYARLVESLTEKFLSFINPPGVRDEVERILPSTLSAHQKRRRLTLAFGLDKRSALRIENYRQQLGDGITAQRDVEAARRDAVRVRGNTLATTETNRAVNETLEALWISNQEIAKADESNVVYFDRSIRGKIPSTAKKEIITRRDGRVCQHCGPLDGLTARLGEEFETDYGFFQTPPFHPHCRCFLIVRAR